MIAWPGDHIWVNGVVDSSADDFAEVEPQGSGQQKVTFDQEAIFSVTGLTDNQRTCNSIHFVRENRGREAGRIYCGTQNLRHWPRLRAAVLTAGDREPIYATG